MPGILQSLSDRLGVIMSKFRARTLHSVPAPPEVEYVPVSRRPSLQLAESSLSGGEAAANTKGRPGPGTASASVAPSTSNLPQKSNSSTPAMPMSVPSHPRSIATPAPRSRGPSAPQLNGLAPPRSTGALVSRPESAAKHVSSPAAPRTILRTSVASRRARKLSQGSQTTSGVRAISWDAAAAVGANNHGGVVSELK
ncbi:hypothetical protein M427DRAFT_145599 [Gonapodya prolifera JEL478]|uniref:Uncharacterized protein n=1 Tax=Gonapodya prolifera (strain JEL478) TaxID=1344416 RepID=A0A139AF78_GONPJ|nr:hypothetical protein M427DRAFT_145599 [Gonapodya prolifera JEL478]|eukprot:KXS15224.1 hypothetical protein M427DRAFT_145599 [Gonapodya prolifera JEL478]